MKGLRYTAALIPCIPTGSHTDVGGIVWIVLAGVAATLLITAVIVAGTYFGLRWVNNHC